MAGDNSLVESVKDEWSGVRGRAGDMLHRIWPFRDHGEEPANGDTPQRETVPFVADVYETRDDFVLVGEVPGVRKEDLDIQVTDTELTVTGRMHIGLDKDERVVFGEIPGADYHRAFTLSDAVDRDNVRAEMKDGVVTVRLAKSSQIRPRQITIN